jgi:hypothetical protein
MQQHQLDSYSKRYHYATTIATSMATPSSNVSQIPSAGSVLHNIAQAIVQGSIQTSAPPAMELTVLQTRDVLFSSRNEYE